VCKASHEPGGPQRCSGDARRTYQQSAADVGALEQREHDLQRVQTPAVAAAEDHCDAPREHPDADTAQPGRPVAPADAGGRRPLSLAQNQAGPHHEQGIDTVLCKSCWQAAILNERRTGLSRLKGYRRRHPHGALAQCDGKVYW
jgi:hypothetical protein